MIHNIISKNDASHGIVRIPADVRSLFHSSGKCDMIVNGTRRTVNRCRDMVTGLGRIFREAGVVGGEQATWASVKDEGSMFIPTLTFCAGAGAPSVETQPEPTEPDADLIVLGTTRLRDLCVDMGLSGYGKLNAADLRMFITKARRNA